MSTITDPIVLQRPLDMADLARAIGAENQGRGWWALFPFAFGTQRLFPSQHFRRPLVEVVNGAAGVALLTASGPPLPNHLRYFMALEAYHDSAVSQVILLQVRTTIGGSSQDVTLLQAIAAVSGQRILANRPIMINESQSIIFSVPTLPAGDHLFTRTISFDLLVGEDFITL